MEVDAASSSASDAATESASDAELLDCAVGMCEEHGLLGALAGGAEDDDVLGMTADADFFAAGNGGIPTWAAAAREDGSAAVAVAVSAGDCAVSFCSNHLYPRIDLRPFPPSSSPRPGRRPVNSPCRLSAVRIGRRAVEAPAPSASSPNAPAPAMQAHAPPASFLLRARG